MQNRFEMIKPIPKLGDFHHPTPMLSKFNHKEKEPKAMYDIEGIKQEILERLRSIDPEQVVLGVNHRCCSYQAAINFSAR